MKKAIWKYGLLSGGIASLLMLITLPFEDKIGDHGYLIGYTAIVVSFLMVFFGIRSYRAQAGGEITFTKGFLIGISITLIMCAFYVITWEILYFNFMHDFMDKYIAHVLAKAKASGASEAALKAQMEGFKKTRALYENPLYNSAITFLEPFPVGLLITLLSAAVLRRKKRAPIGEVATQAS